MTQFATQFALPSLVASLVALACGLAVIARERFSNSGWLHFFLAASVALWQLCISGMLGATNPADAARWVRAAVASVILLPAIQFHFSYSLTRGRTNRVDAVTWVWVGTAILEGVLLLSDQFVTGTMFYRWGAYPRYGIAGALFCAYTIATLAASAWIYAQVIRSNPVRGVAWRRSRLLLTTLCCGSVGVLDFLPAFGVDLFPAGGMFVALALVPNIYAAHRYRLVEVTPALAAQEIMNTMTDGVLLLDRDGLLRQVNPAACEILGYGAAQLLHGLPPQPVATLLYGEPQQMPYFPQAPLAPVERSYQPPAGTPRALRVSISHIGEPGETATAAVVTLHDETAVRAAQEQIHRLAYYDALTGLPNRRLLRERFQQAIAWAERSGTKVAVLFLDLDRFKQVNDSLGHDAGDQLLQVVSERITASVRESDLVLRGPDDAGSTLARLGGDEFVLLLSPIARGEDAAKAAMRILQTLSDPVRLRTGDEVTTGVSIGIALYPGDGRDADTLMKRADLAMYHAKATGRSNAKFYDEALNTATEQRVGLETSLRRALSGHEFLVRYQPVIAADGAAVALDTQLFWRHPERGLLPEREFYDVARDAGLALNLGEWTIRVACDQMQAWQGSGRAPGALMVTASQALLDRGTLPDLLRDALAECGFDPANLWVCVRNGTTTVPGSRAAESLRALSALGLQVVLDDFDAGRMSVPDLIAQPVGMVRLSGAWLGTVPMGGDAAVAARALIGLAHDLGMRVIASGVDDAATAACLRDLDCDFQLGAAHAAPLDAEDVQGASA